MNLTADNGNRLLMGLAERADLIVDFTNVPVGNYVLGNVGPDEPFGGGVPGVDFAAADPLRPARSCSSGSCPPWRPTRPRRRSSCVLPADPAAARRHVTRPLALIEKADVGLRRGRQ